MHVAEGLVQVSPVVDVRARARCGSGRAPRRWPPASRARSPGGRVGVGRRRCLPGQLEVAGDQRRIAAAAPPAPRPRGRAAAAGGPAPRARSTIIRRRSWAKSYSASRSTISPRVSSSSKPATTSSSERPLVGPHGFDVERAADHRRRGQHLGGGLGDGVQAGTRTTSRAPGPGRGSASPAASSSARIQRQALALGVEPIGDALVQARCPRQLGHVGCGSAGPGSPGHPARRNVRRRGRGRARRCAGRSAAAAAAPPAAGRCR